MLLHYPLSLAEGRSFAKAFIVSMVINKLKCFKGMGCGTSKLSTSGPEVIEVKPRTQTQDAVYEYDFEGKNGWGGILKM